MSIKDLFNGQNTYKIATSSSMDTLGNTVESADYIREYSADRQRFVPAVDFNNPSQFAFFGSAEEYYRTTIQRIHNTYPYDGTQESKLRWHNNSSYLDNWFFDNEYPRTHGYVTLGYNQTGSITTSTAAYDDPDNAAAHSTESFSITPNPQFIHIKGGPNAPDIRPYDGYSHEDTDYKDPLHKANVFDQTTDRESNLLIHGASGSTVEFWFKAGGAAQNSPKFLGHSKCLGFFDLWNSGSIQAGADYSGSYGRLLIEMRRDSSEYDKLIGDNLFYVTCMSGTSGFERVGIGSGSLTGSNPLDEWNHFAFTMKNRTSDMELKFYLNGELQDTITTGSTIGMVRKGPHLANLGAYIHAPTTGSAAIWGSGADVSYSDEGIGCVSGSFDEFRFWKESRDSEKINRFYNDQVGGGSNREDANKHLGVYYKFNEGITEIASVDQTVLDYSGRISNGLIKNYDKDLSMRSSGSAIVENNPDATEFKDPIIYPYHPEVQSTLDQFEKKGMTHDYSNANMLYHSIPSWVIEEDESNQEALKLFQIMSSYFDTLHLQIKNLPHLKDVTYRSGSLDKPLPFASHLLESAGFFAPEIFPNATVLEQFMDRDDEGLRFERKLHDTKNFIYENIYNNLTYINKSKGTTKSIRNLIRCFGVDDELYNINFYADGITFRPEDSYRSTTVRKNYANFHHAKRNNAVVFQSTSSVAGTSGYINGSAAATGYDSDIAMAYEAEFIFPASPPPQDPNLVSSSFGYHSSSMFGVHTALSSSAALTWATDDVANFQVYAVRDHVTQPNSKNVYFQLQSTTDGIMDGNEITSSLFYDVYDDQRWNFLVNVKPRKYPNSTLVSSSADDYIVEFRGANMVGDIVAEEFHVTASVSNTLGKNFMTSDRRMYVGAHRTNFDGGVITPSDLRASGVRVWMIPLTRDEFLAHARDATNYGVSNPQQSAYLTETRNAHTGLIPKIDTLALHWDFSNVTGSDASGEFVVTDLSSGSDDTTFKSSKYGSLSPVLCRQHPGQGMFFPASESGSISKEYVATAKTQFMENLNNENFVQVLAKDDQFFGRKARPIRYFFSVEKSMYQTISDEMIDFFANAKGLSAYSSMIGDPANKYRQEYKSLKGTRSLFFDKVSNTPDLEKYTRFYKWFDEAISAMILNLVPATSDFSGVQNVVESHIFERNKYQHKFPTLDMKHDYPSGSLKAINDLKYNWKFGHAPLPSADAVAATATITVIDSSAVPGVPYIGAGDTIQLISTGGTTVTLTMQGTGGSTTSTSTSGTSLTAKTLASGSYADSSLQATAQAVEIRTAINHHTLFTATNSANVITVTQKVAGAAGNTTVTKSELGATGMTNTNFTAGTDTRTPQNNNALWWKHKAERDHRAPSDFNTGNTGIDESRGAIHSASLESFNRDLGRPYTFVFDDFVTMGTKSYRSQMAHLKFDSNNEITMKESDVTDALAMSGNDDYKDLFPPRKIKAALYGNLDGKIHAHLFPFNLYSSSVASSVSTSFKEGLIITDQHRDLYHTFENEPLQGPFTETHVGGNQHRHVSLNRGPKEQESARNRKVVNDDSEVRPEAWAIEFGVDNTGRVAEKTIKLVGPTVAATGRSHGTDHPMAIYLRDETAKRPVSIKNIHYTTQSQNIGNFDKNYEVVMTSGRNINNHFFIENLGVSETGSASTLISGALDFTLPDRSQDAYKTRSIIAERFSAPGDPATLGRGYMDTESESFSVYNALPWRNMSVRSPLRTLLSSSSGQFGLNEGYSFPSDAAKASLDSIASYHKTNRNSAKRNEHVFKEGKTVAATATITVIDSSAAPGVPYIGEGDTIELISTDETTVTLTMQGTGGSTTSAETSDITLTARTLASGSYADSSLHATAQAVEIKTAVNHHTKFTATNSANVVTITQADAGEDGNTTITITELGATGFSKTNFAGGRGAGGEDNRDIAHVTGTLKDNWYVQHQIPQSVMQYSWITASADSGPYGFESPDHSQASFASTDITFASASDFGSFIRTNTRYYGATQQSVDTEAGAYLGFIPNGFSALNLNVVEPVSSSENTLGYNRGNNIMSYLNVANLGQAPTLTTNFDDGLISRVDADNPGDSDEVSSTRADIGAAATTLNAVLLHRDGPYGYPSWKQTRIGDHPIARYQKNNNITSHTNVVLVKDPKDPSLFLSIQELTQITEAPVVSKFKPLVHEVFLKGQEIATETGGTVLEKSGLDIKSTYGNDLYQMVNQVDSVYGVNFLDIVGVGPTGPSPNVFELRGDTTYDHLKRMYITKEISDDYNPIDSDPINLEDNPVSAIIYKETVWPKAENAYLSKTRTRGNYDLTRSEFSQDAQLGQQRTFWRDSLHDRCRTDTDRTLNTMGTPIDKDATKGFPVDATTEPSGGVFIPGTPNVNTTVTASGGSAALSVWPLDCDGEGGAVFAKWDGDEEADTDSTAGGNVYLLGRGNGELTNSDDWTLYYKDFPATASIGYDFIQLLPFSGAVIGRDTGGSFGHTNFSAKVPKYQTNTLIGVNPWFDSYEDYAADVRPMSQGYSLIPEFKISDHMQYYLDAGTFEGVPSIDYLEIEGATTTSTSSAPGPDLPLDSEFFKTFGETTSMTYLSQLKEDHSKAGIPPSRFTISFDGIMKLLPYQGFYPVLRTTQLATLFSASWGPYIGAGDARAGTATSDENNWPSKPDGLRNQATRTAALMQPWFNPGIMFNSIKSGIAVDWATIQGATDAESTTGDDQIIQTQGCGFLSASTVDRGYGTADHGGPNFRFPFESLIVPEQYIPMSASDDAGRISHLAPQWKNYSPGNSQGLAGGVTERPGVVFTFDRTSTNGYKVGIESPLGTKITGTVDSSAGSSNASTIGTSGVDGSGTDMAQRFYDWFAAAATASLNSALTAEQEDAVVKIYAHYGPGHNGSDITNGGGTLLDHVTITGKDGAAADKFSGGQEANLAFFDWRGHDGNKNYYSLAMHNFLAEVPNFFLQNGTYTTIISDTQDKFDNFQSGTHYYMDIAMHKNKDMVMYEGPAAYQVHGSRTNYTASARGMHYGPNLQWTNEDIGTGNEPWLRNLADPAPAAYTPPYFYGTSIARLRFSPKADGAYALDEIFENIFDPAADGTVDYLNMSERHPDFLQDSGYTKRGLASTKEGYTDHGIATGIVNTPASASIMHLSSSFHLRAKSHPITPKYDADGNVTELSPGTDPAWVISPKWECPVMNFSGNAGPTKGTADASLRTIERACFDGMGMWKGSGSIPQKNDGIWVSVRESFPVEQLAPGGRIGSLVQACGFSTEKKRIGSIRGQKTISEAIVAIPYFETSEGAKFISINPQTYKTIFENVKNGKPDVDTTFAAMTGAGKVIPETSIGDMIRKMKKFVIPPFLDFSNPENYDPLEKTGPMPPFVMYIMEFSHSLDREDLQRIWQNVMPKIAQTAKKTNNTLSHPVGVPWEFDIFGPEATLLSQQSEMKFKIFKVKQRAKNNYFATVPKFEGDEILKLQDGGFQGLALKQELPYSYNWPYDFFSLIEVGKLDGSVTFSTESAQDAGFGKNEFTSFQSDSSTEKGDET